jgi:hypothetical protein
MSLDEKAFLAAVETARTKAEEDEAADRKREKKSKKVTLAPADPPIVTSPTASQKPSTSSSSSSSSSASSNGSNSTSPLTATGARLSEWGKLKDKRIDEARKKIIAEREEKELANASFKPDLSLVRNEVTTRKHCSLSKEAACLQITFLGKLTLFFLSSLPFLDEWFPKAET